MRIISKWKDFYDNAASYGVDVEKVYVRDTRDTNIDVSGDWRQSSIKMDKFDLIGFCGEIYPFLNGSSTYDAPDVRKERILYGHDAVKFERNHKYPTPTHPQNKEPFFVEDENYNSKWKFDDPQLYYDKLVNNEVLKQIFHQYKVPVFYIRRNAARKQSKNKWTIEVVLNPNLQDLCFFKVKDSVQAFAEIHQYLDVIQSQDTQVDVPVGGNDVVGRSKGFDETSFRKEPTKKKYSKKSKTKKL